MRLHEILKKYFEKKKSSNSRFSLRLLARQIHVSPAQISMIFSGKRVPSMTILQEISDRLEIDDETRIFLQKEILEYQNPGYKKNAIHLVQKTSTQKENKQSTAEDQVSQENADFILATKRQFVAMKSWHYLAIVQTMLLTNFDGTGAYIAKFLGLGLPFVNNCLKELLEVGLVDYDKQKGYSKKNLKNEFRTSDRAQLTHWHVSNIEDTLQVLRGRKTYKNDKERLVIGSCIPCSTEKLPVIRSKLVDFLKELISDNEGGGYDEVCRLSIHMVPLSSLAITDGKLSEDK